MMPLTNLRVLLYLTLTLYECDPLDSFEISIFDEVDAFYTFGHDATMDDAYKDELAIVLMLSIKLLLFHPHLIALLSF